eukprot:347947-Chlamydomonas_euryale.AAC.6
MARAAAGPAAVITSNDITATAGNPSGQFAFLARPAFWRVGQAVAVRGPGAMRGGGAAPSALPSVVDTCRQPQHRAAMRP